MAYGLQVLNNSGATQVDEMYSNYRVIASGMGTGKNIVYFTDYGVKPLIMVRPVNFGTWIAGYNTVSTNSFTALCGNSGTQEQFYYKVLVPMIVTTVSTEAYGLRVFDSSGGLTFDSGHTDQLRVSLVVDYTPSTTAYYITAPTSTGDYYVSLNPCNLINVYITGQNGSNTNWTFVAARQTTENTFEVMAKVMTTGPSFAFNRGAASTAFFFGTFL